MQGYRARKRFRGKKTANNPVWPNQREHAPVPAVFIEKPMRHFDNLVEATQALNKAGYTHEFTLKRDRIHCEDLDKGFAPRDFEVEQVLHFEGADSSPDTRSTLFLIKTKSGAKGTLIEEDGMYGTDNVSSELLEKFKQHK